MAKRQWWGTRGTGEGCGVSEKKLPAELETKRGKVKGDTIVRHLKSPRLHVLLCYAAALDGDRRNDDELRYRRTRFVFEEDDHVANFFTRSVPLMIHETHSKNYRYLDNRLSYESRGNH